jgi:allantoinase
VITPDGERDAAVVMREGRILAIVASEAVPSDTPVLDFGSRVVMAGVVDSHVHVNEPGRTEWEGFETATRAAAAGGVTTLVDMPLNSIPVTTGLAALETKRAAARGRCHVDVAFWAGVVPGNATALGPMLEAGVPGAKAFLIDSGIDDFPASAEADLRAAMPQLAARGAVLLAHAELACVAPPAVGDPARHNTWLASRPRAWENEAIALLLRLAREYRCRVHIVHLSSADALAALAAAQADGARVTAETCPHYLVFESESIPDGRTEFKCAPPIRERENRERLWRALESGVLEMVVSDHSPCAPALKDGGDFMAAWGGIASVQLSLPAVWTEARRRSVTLSSLALWMCERPAELAGLGHRKGRLAPGYDADLVVWDPDASFTVEPALIRHRHSLTPYLGRRLFGVVHATFVRGLQAFGAGASESPRGELLTARLDGLH